MGAPIVGYGGAILIASPPSVNSASSHGTTSVDNQNFQINNSTYRYLDPNQAQPVQVELDEVQTVSITGSPTGGTFTLTFGGDTTTGIAWDATAAQVQTALAALPSIGPGNVVCTGGPLPATPVQVEFTGTLGFANQATMTESSAGLTGGTSPAVVIAVPQNGQIWTNTSSGFTIQHIGAWVRFAAPYLGASVGVRFSSIYYFAWATLANVTMWQFDGQATMIDNTSMLGDGNGGLQAGAGWKTFQPLLLEGTFSVTKFWVPESQSGFVADITGLTLFIISGATLSGNRYEGYAYLKKLSIKDDVAKLDEESLDFQLSSTFYTV